MCRNDSRRARWALRYFVRPHFMVLAIAIIVCAIEPWGIGSAEAALPSSGVPFNEYLKTIFSSMVLTKYTLIFGPSVNKQSPSPLFYIEQFTDRNLEPASSDLVMRPNKTDRAFWIVLSDEIRILEKFGEPTGTGPVKVGLLDHFYSRGITAVFDNWRKKPIRNIGGPLVVYCDGLDGLQKQEGRVTGDSVASNPHIYGNLYRANDNQRKGEDRLGDSGYKLSSNRVGMGKTSYVADEAGPVYFPLLAFVVTLVSVPLSVAEIMFAVAKYYRGSRRAAAVLFIFGACTTPLAFLWFLISLVSENASGSPGACCLSATTYGRAEDVGIAPIVVPKFKFRNIEGQIFTANLVITPDNAAFDERPEAL